MCSTVCGAGWRGAAVAVAAALRARDLAANRQQPREDALLQASAQHCGGTRQAGATRPGAGLGAVARGAHARTDPVVFLIHDERRDHTQTSSGAREL
jgi:hypothetical protein